MLSAVCEMLVAIPLFLCWMKGGALVTNLEAFASAVFLIMSAMIEVLLSPIQFTETLKRY